MNMDGILLINKDKDMTSRDVVNKLIPLFNTKKIGHTGTLDPLATGVLVCCIGKYTKLVDLITAYDKEYVAEITLGIMTDTGDITGNIIGRSNTTLTSNQIKTCLDSFVKTYDQTVPKYSAVKIKGKKLYEYARENKQVALPKRKVTIYQMELLDISDNKIKFKCLVSKGTYIRSLIEDICKQLGVCGTMSNLKRTKQGNFALTNCYTLKDIEKNNYQLLEVGDIFPFPKIEVDDEVAKKIQNGAKIANSYFIDDKVIFYYHNRLLAIYQNDNDILKSYVQF